MEQQIWIVTIESEVDHTREVITSQYFFSIRKKAFVFAKAFLTREKLHEISAYKQKLGKYIDTTIFYGNTASQHYSFGVFITRETLDKERIMPFR